MQGNGRGRNNFSDFGAPFGGFGGFGGLGGHGDLLSGFLGGRDPFDDPFFTRPFGGGLFESNLFGSGGNPFAGGMFHSNFLGPTGNAFPGMHPSGFLRHEAPNPRSSRGPVIEELISDDEKEDDADEEMRGNPKKHGRSSNEPLVEFPGNEAEGKKSKHLQSRVNNNMIYTQSQPHTRQFTFQSSSVTYGGPNGAYYTSSKTRRAGSDGVMIEESKEADSTTGQATHRLSRGLHHKGHSVTRKLNPDGKVDAMQILHNLDEDELPSFEENWKQKARAHLPGLNENFIDHDSSGSGIGHNMQANRGGWALPSTQLPQSQSSRNETLDAVNPPPNPQYYSNSRMSGDGRQRRAHGQGRRY